MARPTLFKHRKFQRLVFMLGAPVSHVLGYLECMWHVGYESGDPYLGDAVDVELACQWPGERGVLCARLCEAGFVEIDEAGRHLIHDLTDHAPEYVRKRMQREQGRKNRYSHRSRPLCAKWRENGNDERISPPNSALLVSEAELGQPPAPTPRKTNKGRVTPLFVAPTVEQVAAYCRERNNRVDATAFVAHYESNGWRVGRSPMKSWQAAVITWEKNEGRFSTNGHGKEVDLFKGVREFLEGGPLE